MDNINMTDKQMNELINGLADELVKRIYGVQNKEESDAVGPNGDH